MDYEKIRIESDRLVMRGLETGDEAALYSYRSRAEVAEFQSWMPGSIEEVREFIEEKIAKQFNVPNTWYQFGIFLRDTSTLKLIGDIGVHFIDEGNKQIEIGYTISPEYQGKGYAAEAVAAIIDYMFKSIGKHRVSASVDPRNLRSVNLLERLGFRKEAHFKKSIWWKGEWADDLIFSILEEEWERKQR